MTSRNQQRRRLFYSVLFVAGAFIASGCATPPPVPINYAPSSTLTATGAVKIADFKYLPAETSPAPAADAKTSAKKKSSKATSPVKPNQIRNTAMGNIFIDRDVKTLIRDAVFAELRFVGIKTDSPTLTLQGDIQEFLIDDLGYSVDWTLRIRYELVDSRTQSVVYEGVKNIQRNTAKFVNVFGALNETIKLNVEELVKDDGFAQKIK